MNIKDGYYASGEPQYIGALPIRQEVEILPEDKSVKGWTIRKVVGINGNKYLKLLSAYLKKCGKLSENDLTPEEIEFLYSKCEI